MRMQALLEDLLEVSRVQRARLEVEEVDLAVVLADLMVALNPMLEEAGVRLESDPLPVVMGSRDFLSKTLRHLIENGVKFRRGEDPWVRISADKGRSEWRLCVEDNGIGIAPEFHERVMQAFQRLHVRHEYAGNGVGLALCRQIIEMHGGRIWIESALGEGAAVHFTLPFEVRAAEPRGLGAPSTPPPPEA